MSQGLYRSWIGTLNNPTEDGDEILRNMYETGKLSFCAGQLEKGKEGTPHLQFVIHFTRTQRMSACKKLSDRAHFEPCKNLMASLEYVRKPETRQAGPWEFGNIPVKVNDKDDWDRVRELAKEGKFEEIPSNIFIKHYGNLKKIHAENIRTEDLEECRGVWLWGPPGTGKTTFARTEYADTDDVYIKAQNKWWDGYKGQKIVILDDLDTPVLGHYIKIWADKWGCTGEIKGGTVGLKHEKFIVTSNYSIEQLFTNDSILIEAIKRRFKVTHFNAPLGK